MEELTCPRCKTTKYRNPALKLLVNTCGHALCDNCVELLFVKGSAACPECQTPLRRSGFRLQLFEDPAVEKEVDIRKRVLKDFNKQEHDFPSLREYNDYLEQIETIIFKLTNNVEVVETNKLIEQYKKENKEQIAKSRSQKSAVLLELEAIIEEETKRSEFRRVESLNSEKEEKLRKLRSQEALIDDLMFLESDAKAIVESHKSSLAAASAAAAGGNSVSQENDAKTNGNRVGSANFPQFNTATAAATTFTSGIGIGGSATFLRVPKAEDVPLFVYQPLVLDIGGPSPPSEEALRSSATAGSFLAHIRPANESEIAGGYHHGIACRRALQDAFMDIGMQPKFLRNLHHHQATEAKMMEAMDTS